MTSTTFHIHNPDVRTPDRQCQSLLTAEEEDQLIYAGFAIPAHGLPPAAVTVLGDAVDALAAARFSSPDQKTYQEDFPGQYIRDPHKIDPRLLTVPLLDYPLADTARAVLGPRIVLRNSNVRITHPRSGDSTIWHTDYRPHVSPPPRLGAVPAVITALIYSTRPMNRPGRCTSSRALTAHRGSRPRPWTRWPGRRNRLSRQARSS
jgi:hypothetical protein